MLVSVRYHKADVVYHGQHIMTSQRCRPWRPEANLRDEDGVLAATAYFGMGAQEATGLEHNFIVFTRKLSVLVAIMDVLGDDRVERQARGCQ